MISTTRGFILPTAPILQDRSELDEAFFFYEGGFAGVVSTLITCYDQDESSQVIEQIMQEYMQTPEAKLEQLLGKRVRQNMLEMLLECLKEEVDCLMYRFFSRVSLSIEKQQYDWIGKDLVIYAQPILA